METTITADTADGITVCQPSEIPANAERLEPDDFITALDQVQDGDTIAATFADDDDRLSWLDEKYGINGW
jgi:hypothetical protein